MEAPLPATELRGHGYLKVDLDVVDTDCFLRKVGRGLIMSQNIWVPAPLCHLRCDLCTCFLPLSLEYGIP